MLKVGMEEPFVTIPLDHPNSYQDDESVLAFDKLAERREIEYRDDEKIRVVEHPKAIEREK